MDLRQQLHAIRAVQAHRVRLDSTSARSGGGIRGEQRPRKEQPGPQGHKPDRGDFLERVAVVERVDASGAGVAGQVVADDEERVRRGSDPDPGGLLPLDEPPGRDVIDADEYPRRQVAESGWRVLVEAATYAADPDGVGREVGKLVNLGEFEVGSTRERIAVGVAAREYVGIDGPEGWRRSLGPAAACTGSLA